MSVLGQKALDVALSEMGLGEEGGNNKGPHVKKWCTREGAAWCAGVVSWCLKIGSELAHMDPPKYSIGARRLGDNLLAYPGAKKIAREKDLFTGDIPIYSRPSGGKHAGHTGIVLLRAQRGYVTIEGNKGLYPAIFGPVFRPYGEPNFLYAVRLP